MEAVQYHDRIDSCSIPGNFDLLSQSCSSVHSSSCSPNVSALRGVVNQHARPCSRVANFPPQPTLSRVKDGRDEILCATCPCSIDCCKQPLKVILGFVDVTHHKHLYETRMSQNFLCRPPMLLEACLNLICLSVEPFSCWLKCGFDSLRLEIKNIPCFPREKQDIAGSSRPALKYVSYHLNNKWFLS